jgi:aryl-alcohol dehydrogenase-like predicted oxidoreductase
MPMLNRKGYSEFTLGTAQLGMEYGIANSTGKPSKNKAISIIRQAVIQGVTSIDTARSYGESEAIIGESLAEGLAEQVEVITKLDTLETLNLKDLKTVQRAVDRSIMHSCQELRTNQLSTLLLHRWEHRFACQQAIWERLLFLKKQDYIQKLGVSVYTPKDAIEALKDPEIKHIQLPFNILDLRWKAAGIPQLAQQRSDVVIHARSVLLQGLLIADSATWARLKKFNDTRWLGKLDRLVKELGVESRTELCFAYVRAQPWITSIVVGVETVSQLDENIKLFQKPYLTIDECQQVEAKLEGATEELLNPAKWRIN